MAAWIWTRDDESQRQTELGDEHRQWEAWEARLLTDDQVRERRMLDDDERRCDGLFDRDRELADDFSVVWGDDV